MSKAKFSQETREWYDQLLKDKTTEEKIKSLEIVERQKYNYYCDMSAGNWNWTAEQVKAYEDSWNEIIEMINELKAGA